MDEFKEKLKNIEVAIEAGIITHELATKMIKELGEKKRAKRHGELVNDEDITRGD